MTVKEYLEFMLTPENSNNCQSCPENKGMDAWQDRKPCGQWHCRVDLHAKRGGEHGSD